jgi:hypothetical protein
MAVMKKPTTTHYGRGVKRFLANHGADVTGVIAGYDRLRLRGSLRYFYQPTFMFRHLCNVGVLLKNFGPYATALSNRVRDAAHAFAQRCGRPWRYLYSTAESKEALARQLAERDRIKAGLIGVFDCVEPCLTYFVRGDRQAHRLELKLESGKCLHHYFYFQHPEFGLMHVRLQTWFPFQVMVCVNGRLWLARQLDRAGIGYVQRDNSFAWIKDSARAQALAQAQLRVPWPTRLQELLADCHPLAAEIGRPLAQSYYWSIDQSEYATDLMFKTPAALAAIYPALVHHGIRHFGTPEVLRFLGRTVPAHGRVHRLYQGEVETGLTQRPEGLRLKHYVNGNSIKIYDKHGQVLRVETTLTHPEDFRVFRTPEDRPKGKKRWMQLRKSVADSTRRAQVCAAANDRYLAALAAAPADLAAGDAVQSLCRRVVKNGRRYRALNPWAPDDAALLQVVGRGEWTLNGFRNRDVRAALLGATSDLAERRRRTGRVTRALALLRAHGLIRKITRTHRYMVTAHGREIITAILSARQASVPQLLKIAA